LDEGTLATRLLVAYAGPPDKHRWPPETRLRSNSDADVSLVALASDAGLSRLRFCRAYWKHGPLHDVVEPMVDHVIIYGLTAIGGEHGGLCHSIIPLYIQLGYT